MSTIFISHSSANNGLALALRDWLVREGWHDLFLDIDVERGIVAGSRWLKALTEAGTRAKAVVFLITPEWIQSRYCHAEFFSAVEKGKPIFGLLAAKLHFNDIPVEMRDAWQLCDLINGSEFEEFTVAGPPSYLPEKVGLSKGGLAQLRRGLFEIGLGILDTESFAWPARGLECEPDGSPRRPWRGLEAIDEPDAGVFFGRDGAIHRALASISDLRASGGRELMVVLGASGSGKSSFLRAGLLPRLRRLDTAYLVLPLARPLDAAISGRFGLAASLQRALSEARQPANRSDLERELVGESNALSRRLDQIRSAATGSSVGEHKGRTLILPLDQAEELFQSGPSEAQALLGGLAEALRHGPEMIVIATIRTDSYEPLQRADIPQSVFPLSPLGPGEYRATIEGPIGRLKKDGRELTVEPDLIDKLVAEAAGPDALPLLGFVLQRLYEGYADDRILNLRDYEKLGGLGRCIDEAVSSALGGSGHTPQIALDEAAPVRMVALAFPALVSIDEEKQTPVRRIAQWSEIPELARPIVERLVAQRLLRSDLVGTQPVVEIAHEALLRHWPALDAWIAAERTNLASVQAVERASFEWHQRTRSEAWLLHRTERLANAEDIRTNRPELAARWGKLGDSYLRACRGIETKQRSRQLRTAWTVAAGASIRVAIAGWLLVEERQQTAIADIAKAAAAEQGRLAEEAAGEALAQKALAEQAAARAREEAQEASRQSALLALDTARGLTEQGDLDQAILLALDAEQTLRGAANDSVLVTLAAIAARAGGQHVSNAGGDTNSLYSLPDGIFGLVRQGLEIVAVGPAGLARLGTLPEPGRVLGQTGHDAPLFVIGADWEARSFDPETGRVSVLGEIHPPERDAAIFGDDGLIITLDETNLHLFDVFQAGFLLATARTQRHRHGDI